jgi:phosphate transport system substrate-binding protein
MKKIFAAACMGLFALAPVFCGGGGEKTASGAGQDAPYTIEAAGSTSVTPLMELLAAGYKKLKPNIKVNINGTGSSDGIKAAAAGTSELGMSSRELKPAEKGSGLTELTIAIDGIAVIVNPANPLADISIAQIRDVYSGKISDWAELTGGAKKGKIAVVSREPGSGTRGAFEELAEIKDKLAAGATEFDGTGAIKAEISRNADAIGYISLGSVDASAKALSIENIAATTDNVVNGSYKISRPFILLCKNASLKPQTKEFLAWIMSPDGQAIVGKSWIPVK